MRVVQNIFLKLLLTFIIILSIISSSVIAKSKSDIRNNNIIYKSSSIIINNKTINPKDSRGNIIGPVIINGMTYVPVTSVVDALSKSAYWSHDQSVLYISDKANNVNKATKYLGISSLKPYQKDDLINFKSDWQSGKSVYIQQEAYNTADSIFAKTQYDSSKIIYMLNDKYSKLEGLYAIDDMSPEKPDDKYGYLEILRYDKEGKLIGNNLVNKTDRTMLSGLYENIGYSSAYDKDGKTTYKYQYDEDGNIKNIMAYDKNGKSLYQLNYGDDDVNFKFSNNDDSFSASYQKDLKSEIDNAIHGKGKTIYYQYVKKYDNPNNNDSTKNKPDVYYQNVDEQSQNSNKKI